MNKELEVLDLTLDLMERFIQPTIFMGLKSDLNAIDFKLNRLAKVEELLKLYRKHYRNGMGYDHNGKLIHQIVKLEEELK